MHRKVLRMGSEHVGVLRADEEVSCSAESSLYRSLCHLNDGSNATRSDRECAEVIHVEIQKPVIIVDGSNVAYGAGSSTPTAERLERLEQILRDINAEVITVVDASLRHKVADRDQLNRMLDEGLVFQAPAGRPADVFIVQLARVLAGRGLLTFVLTNDSGIERRLAGWGSRIAFMVVRIGDEEVLLLDQHPSESLGEDLGLGGHRGRSNHWSLELAR